ASPPADAGGDGAPPVPLAPPPPPERPWPAPAPGKLVLIGDSAFLENDRLQAAEFRGDQLLWNVVAGLVLEPELAAVATRARATRGLGLVAPETRLVWRALVIAGGPALLVLGAAAVALARRRAPAPMNAMNAAQRSAGA